MRLWMIHNLVSKTNEKPDLHSLLTAILNRNGQFSLKI